MEVKTGARFSVGYVGFPLWLLCHFSVRSPWVMFPYLLILNITCVAAHLATSFSLASSGRALRPGEKALTKAEMRQHILWGLVYSNPDDPRGWVPRTQGLGWSVNVRTRSAARGYAVISLVLIASIVATILDLAFTIAEKTR